MELGQIGVTGTRARSRAAAEHKDERDPAPTPPLNMAAPAVPEVQTLLKLATLTLAQVRLSMKHMNTILSPINVYGLCILTFTRH